MSEIWYQGQELLRSQQLRGIPMDLAREMVNRKYETRGTAVKIKVEAKVDYKSRIGKSPDIADAAFILVDLCRSRFGFMGGERFETNAKRQKSWAHQIQKLDVAGATTTLLET